MTAAVRKKDEELTTDLKCTIGVLMTCLGLYESAYRFSKYIKEPLRNVPERLLLYTVC